MGQSRWRCSVSPSTLFSLPSAPLLLTFLVLILRSPFVFLGQRNQNFLQKRVQRWRCYKLFHGQRCFQFSAAGTLFERMAVRKLSLSGGHSSYQCGNRVPHLEKKVPNIYWFIKTKTSRDVGMRLCYIFATILYIKNGVSVGQNKNPTILFNWYPPNLTFHTFKSTVAHYEVVLGYCIFFFVAKNVTFL